LHLEPVRSLVVQQARNLSFTTVFERMRFLIHDRDSKFTASFDEVFRSEGIEVIHTPVQAPQANAYAERFVRTVRNECLDWLLILGRRHLDHVLRIYVQHYNRERPHRGLALTQPTQGLTERGRALVRRFGELDVVLDLAHASEQTWRDVLDEDVAFSVTHAGCRAVHDHPRNLADWQLQALAERGGVLGMMGLAFVVDPEAPTLGRWLDHFDHAVALMGTEHVGIGADFVDQLGPDEDTKARLGLHGFTGPDAFPALLAALRERDYQGERLEAIMSDNWLRVLRKAFPN
jgi:hypothetical protein